MKKADDMTYDQLRAHVAASRGEERERALAALRRRRVVIKDERDVLPCVPIYGATLALPAGVRASELVATETQGIEIVNERALEVMDRESEPDSLRHASRRRREREP